MVMKIPRGWWLLAGDYSVSSRCDPQVAGELATTVCSSVILSHTTLKGHTKLVTNGKV